MRKVERINKHFKHRGHIYQVSWHPPYAENMSGFTYYVYSKAPPCGVKADETIEQVSDAFDNSGEFHGRVTYCHRITHHTTSKPAYDWQKDYSYYEIGCDYAHYHDVGNHYTEESVCADAENTIDKLIEAGLLEDKENQNER